MPDQQKSASGYVLRVALIALAYTLTGVFGLRFAHVDERVTLVWAPTGLAIAALLLHGPRCWPGVWLGALAVNLGPTLPLGATLAIATTNTLEALLAVGLLRGVVGFRPALDRARDAVGLLALAVPLAPLVAAAGGTLALLAAGKVAAGDAWTIGRVWYVGDVMGAIIVLPLLVTWASPRRTPSPLAGRPGARAAEAALLLAAIVGSAALAFGDWGFETHGYPPESLPIPFVVWAALRFGPRGVTAASLALAIAAGMATVARRGEFDARGVHEGLNLLWTFVAISAGTGLLIASITAERTVAVADHERVAQALRGMVKGTASPTADAVLGSLVRHLASTLGVAHAVVSELAPQGRSRPLAIWSRGVPRATADLAIGEGGAALRAALGAASYLEAPLVDSTGRTIGAIAVLDDRPLDEAPLTHDLLKVCASRAAAEVERARHEEERRRLEAQVWHAQKLDSIGVLAGGIAHDFNNLLVGVLGNASRALREVPPDSPARATLQMIETAGRRAAELTNQLLAYSGRGRFTIEPIDLSALVDEMIDLIAASVSRKAEVRRELAKDLPPIEGDATQMRQVVMNLLTNASDAIGDGTGQVVVRTGVRRFAREELARGHADGDLPAGEYVFVEVADTGCGMAPATLERIFEPFFTTKFAGRGLGLAAMLGIVRGHRGAILVDSAPGRGSTFVVVLPRASAAPVAPAAAPAASRSGEGTVLVIDDERVVRELARATLEEVGYSVLTGVDGRDGLDVYAAHATEVRAVLLDLTMPRLGGYEVLRELRRLRPGLPVVLTSGYTLAPEPLEPELAVPFLPKPFTPDELLHAIASAIAA